MVKKKRAKETRGPKQCRLLATYTTRSLTEKFSLAHEDKRLHLPTTVSASGADADTPCMHAHTSRILQVRRATHFRGFPLAPSLKYRRWIVC